MFPQKIQPYQGMHPNKVVGILQNNTSSYNQDEEDSIGSFDLDFFTTEKQNTSATTFENKINRNPSLPTVNIEENKENATERKHACQVCLKRFRTKWHLTEHMIVHTGIFPFQCVSCKKGFKRRKALDSHPCIYDEYQEEKQDEPTQSKQDDKVYKCPKCSGLFNNRTTFLKHACAALDDIVDEIVCLEGNSQTEKKIVFKEPHGEAVEVEDDATVLCKGESDFYRDTLKLEVGLDAIANLTGLSLTEVNETLDYFCQKFDPNEQDHKEAVEILNADGAIKIRHKTQDQSENAIEMFYL